MSGRAYLLLVIVCAAWLGARAATQPAGFDFDADRHLVTIAQIREFGGLAPADQFRDVTLVPGTVESRFHVFPPLPYLLMAGTTALAQTDPTPDGVFGLARAFSAAMATLAIVGAGLGVRNLQPLGRGWTVPAVVTVGLALMPATHSLGASVTASTWAFASVGLTTAAATWAVRRNWSTGATLAVLGAATFAVASRQSAYPALLLIPLALFAARVGIRGSVLRLAWIGLAVLAVNGWWLVRNFLATGDPLGTSVYLNAHAQAGLCNIARESPVWCNVATGPWPAWTLMTSTDVLWVFLSRMLVRLTWIDPLTIALWIGMVVISAVGIVAVRVGQDRDAIPGFLPAVAATGIVSAGLATVYPITLSAEIGWSIYARDAFIALIPLVVAIVVLADLRHDRLRTLCLGSGLAFAAAANFGFMLAVLP